jgi:hypothetical protein
MNHYVCSRTIMQVIGEIMHNSLDALNYIAMAGIFSNHDLLPGTRYCPSCCATTHSELS